MPHQILTGFINLITGYTKGEYKKPSDYAPLDYVRVCLMFLTVYKAHCTAYGLCIPQKADVRQDWEKLFASMPDALHQYADEKREVQEESELALSCLSLLDRFESDFRNPSLPARPESWKQEGLVSSESDSRGRNPFPDALFVNLASFVQDKHATTLANFMYVQARLTSLLRDKSPAADNYGLD